MKKKKTKIVMREIKRMLGSFCEIFLLFVRNFICTGLAFLFATCLASLFGMIIPIVLFFVGAGTDIALIAIKVVLTIAPSVGLVLLTEDTQGKSDTISDAYSPDLFCVIWVLSAVAMWMF